MPKKQKKNAAKKEPRKGLDELRKNLGMVGFHVFTVAKSKRKRKSDFIAWSKRDPCKVFLVELKVSGIILVRPFCTPDLTPNVKTAIASTKRGCTKNGCGVRIQKGVEIKPLKEDLRPEHWLSPNGRKELQTLTGIDVS